MHPRLEYICNNYLNTIAVVLKTRKRTPPTKISSSRPPPAPPLPRRSTSWVACSGSPVAMSLQPGNALASAFSPYSARDVGVRWPPRPSPPRKRLSQESSVGVRWLCDLVVFLLIHDFDDDGNDLCFSLREGMLQCRGLRDVSRPTG